MPRRLYVIIAFISLSLFASVGAGFARTNAPIEPDIPDNGPVPLISQAQTTDAFGSGLNSCQPPLTPVTLSNPTIVTDCTQAGVQAALDQGGHITFDCGPNPVTINLTAPLITSNTEDTVIDGQGLVTFDGGNTTRILEKPASPNAHEDKVSGNDLTLQNLRFINARAPAATGHQDGNARGGALRVTSPGTRLHIFNSTFADNSTTSITDEDNQGGAIFAGNIYETLIINSVFTNNEAGNGGAFGGIATGLRVYNSRFSNNRASDSSDGGIVRGHGGAIHLDGVTNSFNPDSNKIVDVCGSLFEGNTAIRGGGAIKTTISDNKGTKATYAKSTFIDNLQTGTTEAKGGGIYHIEDDYDGGLSEDNLEVSQNTFSGNQAYSQGGGVWYLVNGQVTVENNTFYNNRTNNPSLGMGGGLVVGGRSEAPVQNITNNTFANNYAWFHGGGIQAPGDPQVKLTNNIFYYNESERDWADYQMNRTADVDGGGNIQFPAERFNQSGTPDDDKVTPSAQVVDPNLAALADNGGVNQTMALQSGSPAIDAGASGCPTTDQRDAPRVGTCDIGAFEFDGIPPSITPLTISKRATDLNGTLPYTQSVAYQITLSNHSAAIASDVVITDTLPGEVVFKEWVMQETATYSNGVVGWGPQAVAGGSSVQLIFTVDISATLGTPISNTVRFSSGNSAGSAATTTFIAGQPPERVVYLPLLLK